MSKKNRVPVEVEEVIVDAENGRSINGIHVTCTRCRTVTVCLGTSQASVRRACIQLRDQCDERNYYFVEGDDDD